MKNLIIAFFTILILFTSCKKDSKNSGNSSRNLRYEVSGNFTGTLVASYTTATGSTANDPITLPWSKEITYASNVTAAIIAITGNGGVAGQKVTVIITKGGNQVGTPLEITAESSGSFSRALQPIVF